MANSATTVVIRGPVNYAKVLGEPRVNYDKSGHEWSLDMLADASVVKTYKQNGIGDRVKSKDTYLDGKDFVSFRHRLEKKPTDKNPTPEDNKPIKVVDKDGNLWDQTKLIGNGSVCDVKFDVVDYGKGMKKGIYIRAIRVLSLVPYAPVEFDAISEDDEYYVAPDDISETDEPPFETDDEVVM